MNDTDIVYFHINNWMPGKDYPNKEPFITWMNDFKLVKYLGSDEWCKQNKICVLMYPVDMSTSFCVTATKDWVEKHCPSILDEDKQFQVEPDEDGDYIAPLADEILYFLEYSENNFGVAFESNGYGDEYDEDE